MVRTGCWRTLIRASRAFTSQQERQLTGPRYQTGPPTPERPGTVPSDPEKPKSFGDQPDQGVVLVMTTIAKLLAQKQRLLERLQEDPGPDVREEIERFWLKSTLS